MIEDGGTDKCSVTSVRRVGGELGTCLREYHDTVRDFVPPADARWQGQEEEWRPGMVIRHGDLGPVELHLARRSVGRFIDRDFAAPGHVIDDLAQLAWYAVPPRPVEQQRRAQVESAALGSRLRTLCEAYGANPGNVLDALDSLQCREADRIERPGGGGAEPWVTFLDRGDVAETRTEQAWLRAERATVLG